MNKMTAVSVRIERWLLALPLRVRGLISRRDVENDLDDEIAYHVERQTAANIASGMEAGDARRLALLAFGGIERIKDESRDVRGLSSIDAAAHDVRAALHVVRANLRFSLAVILTLALGIGATATMFGVVDRLLLRPPSHAIAPGRLRRVYMTMHGDHTSPVLGYAAYEALRAQHNTIDGIAAYGRQTAIVGHGADARQLNGASATASFFALLGVDASVGRLFTAAEDDPHSSSNVVVLSDELWQRDFGGASSALGRTIDIAEQPYTIIGVLPPGFTGAALRPVDFWVPMSSGHGATLRWTTTWHERILEIVVRLAPTGDPASVGRELTSALHHAAPERSFWSGATLSLRPLSFDDDGNQPAVFPVARWLCAVAIVVLLIACANVINLYLARTIVRRREIAVRLALGISRWRLSRLLLGESLVLAALGGAAGIAIAYGGGELIRRRLLPDVVWDAPPVDLRVLAVAAALTILTGILTGILPVLHAGRTDVVDALKAGSRGSGARHANLRNGLLVTESALAVALLVTAGLFVRSLMNVRSLDLGFQPDRVLSTTIQWPTANDRERTTADWERIRLAVAASPDYEHVALSIGSPLGNFFGFGLRVPGRDSIPTLGGPWISAVSPDYFATVGTTLVEGRLFTHGEGAGTEPVTIVSETMARALWASERALGRCLLIGAGNDIPCARVVGVVREARRAALVEKPTMQYYIPYGQQRGDDWPIDATELLVRTRGAAPPAIATLRAAIARTVPAARLIQIQPMQDRVDPLIRPWRIGAELFALFGALALLVAAGGLYSVIAYVAAQRTHEFGVRSALGARSGQLVTLVMRDAARVAAVGAAIGLGISVAAARWLEPLLFREAAIDPVVIAFVVALLMVVTCVASLLPATRASRVDPLVALRCD